MSTLDSCIVYDIVARVGCTIPFRAHCDGQWPVVATGLTGLTPTGQVRRPGSGEVLLDLVADAGLVIVDQDIIFEIASDKLPIGIYEYGIRWHDGTGFVGPAASGKIRVLDIADKDP